MSIICPTCEEAPRTFRGDLRVALVAETLAENERFRRVLECIAATSDDRDTRTLASAILIEPQHRTDEQKTALRALRDELATHRVSGGPNGA